MSTSCGNPNTETDALMTRRPQFDKSKECVRCKEKLGNIVIRHAVYCKPCFFSLTAVKFRRSLEPSINSIPDGTRRKAMKAGGSLLIGLSGGLGSSVLLELVHQTYFSPRGMPADSDIKGGRDHPRNASVWSRGAVCYVETCNAYPGTKERIEEIRAFVSKYKQLEFIPLRLEDAFSRAWWDKVGGKHPQTDLGIDVTNEELLLSSVEPTDSPVARLRTYISSLPTQTAIPSAVQTLTRLLLLYTAMSIGSSHLFLGTSLTSLSISLISSISQGGGFVVKEEAQEEWIPRISAEQNRRTNGSIRIIRPLRDIGMKECTIWAWWSGLHFVGREILPGLKQSIGPLTKDFIIGLERDYPSTVSTIARTCGKLTPKKGTDEICLLCERPTQSGIHQWKASISIRSLKDASSHPSSNIAVGNSGSPLSLSPFLCYACHTTLTSKSSRGTTNSASQHSVPLPVWVTSNMKLAPSLHRVPEDGEGVIGLSEVWSQRRMGDEEMKAIVSQFMIDADP